MPGETELDQEVYARFSSTLRTRNLLITLLHLETASKSLRMLSETCSLHRNLRRLNLMLSILILQN